MYPSRIIHSIGDELDPATKFIRPVRQARPAAAKKESPCQVFLSWLTEALVEPIFAKLDRSVSR